MNHIRTELSRWNVLRSQLEQMEGIDEQTILDTLEGETNLHDVLLEMADEVMERTAMIEGLKGYIGLLSDRCKRVEGTRETLKSAIYAAMDRAGLRNVTGERVTLSLRAVPASLTITDEGLIPDTYKKQPPPVIDRKELLTAVKGGTIVPGAMLSNGGQTLSMRVK